MYFHAFVLTVGRHTIALNGARDEFPIPLYLSVLSLDLIQMCRKLAVNPRFNRIQYMAVNKDGGSANVIQGTTVSF